MCLELILCNSAGSWSCAIAPHTQTPLGESGSTRCADQSVSTGKTTISAQFRGPSVTFPEPSTSGNKEQPGTGYFQFWSVPWS